MLKRFAFSGIILFATVIFVYGQNPTPTPVMGRTETSVEKITRLDRAHDRLAQQTYSNLYGQESYTNSSRYNPKWRAKMVTLYRKPSDEETNILTPDEKYLQEYKGLLQERKTGIFKLIPDQGCEGEGKVINASPNCLKYKFPGAGSSYSFRLNSYRIRRLADITLVKNSLSTRGILNGAIFVVLGEISIQNVDLNTPGLRFLSKYKPVKNPQEALESARRFAKGVKKDGYIYGRGVFANKGKTFAMRSIAYRGNFRRAEDGVIYNELDFDKRRDIIVVFRVVDVDADGSATIVYKTLRESKSPKLKNLGKDK